MWRNMISALILTAITVGVSWAALPPDGWRVSIPIVEAPGDQNFPDAVAKGDTIHVIWVDQSRLYYKKSCDFGFTWTNPVQISLPQEEVANEKRNISITGFGDYLDVAYAKNDGPPNYTYTVAFARSPNNGGLWEGYNDIISGLNDLPEPSLSAAADSIRLVFHKNLGSDEGLMYTASGNHGGAWPYFQDIDQDVNDYHYPHLITVGNIPHVVFVYPGPPHGQVFHARPMSPTLNWTITNILTGVLEEKYINPHIASDLQARLHVTWENAAFGGWVHYARSLTGGNQWQDYCVLTFDRGSNSCVTAHRNGVLVVFDSPISGSRNIFGRLSTQFGEPESWSDPFQLTNVDDIIESNCCLVNGFRARHLVFARYNATSNYDIWYMANDDSLLSDSPEATAYNWGRHLVRDPWSGLNGRLHAVYFSQGRPHHSYSDDNGTSWSPYHIIENISQVKDSGSYPTVGLVPGPAFNYHPCVVYLNREKRVEYRYQDFNGVWQGFTVRGNTNGINGEPSVAAVGDGRVYVMIPVRWTVSPKQSAIRFYDFYYTDAGPGPEVNLDLISNTTALGDPCITVDGNYDLHCVWRRSGDIKYARRISGIWDTLNYRFRATAPYSKTPFIECYGYQLAVPFVDSFAANNTEVMWTERQLPGYPWLPDPPQNLSLSSAIRSDYPSSASCDFTVWSEQRTTPTSNYDTRWYWHLATAYGWAGQTPPKSYFAHSLQHQDWLSGSYHLITARTEGNAIPYRIATRCETLATPPGGDQIYYSVETGKDNPSFFCTKRDGFIRYARYDVDYGTSQLEYTLTLLNPLYPAYRVKILSYFEGSGSRTEKVLIDGQEHATLDLKPNQLNVSTILVTREYYKNDHKAVVAFQGAGAVKAGLVVYQLEKIASQGYSGGGSQSAEVSSGSRNFQLSLSPNPAYDRAVISYTISVTSRVSLKLFDGAGRLIRVLDKGIRASGVHGFDIPTGKLAQGVYFVRLETTNETKVEKMIIVK